MKQPKLESNNDETWNFVEAKSRVNSTPTTRPRLCWEDGSETNHGQLISTDITGWLEVDSWWPQRRFLNGKGVFFSKTLLETDMACWKIPILNRKHIFKWWISHFAMLVFGRVTKFDALNGITTLVNYNKSPAGKSPSDSGKFPACVSFLEVHHVNPTGKVPLKKTPPPKRTWVSSTWGPPAKAAS